MPQPTATRHRIELRADKQGQSVLHTITMISLQPALLCQTCCCGESQRPGSETPAAVVSPLHLQSTFGCLSSS